MLQRPHLLPLLTIFIFCCSCCLILNGVVSEPQTNLLMSECNPLFVYLVPSISIFDGNLKTTLKQIREQISEQKKHFATSQQGNGGNPVSTLFQCRNYLSNSDCLACFDVAATRILSCTTGSSGAHVVYDGCYLRFDISSSFLQETTQTFNTAYCGNQTEGGTTTTFASVAQKVLMNLQTATPKIKDSFAVMKMTVSSNNGPTIYAVAQCIETITPNDCLNCLNSGYNNMQTCLSYSDNGRAFSNGCFMRYSTTSFFPDNQTIDIIIPSSKQGSSNKEAIIAGVVSSAALALILVVLCALIGRHKNSKWTPRGDTPGASKLKGPITYSYKDLKSATKNFSKENKIGEGGFGVVYKGILKNGKVVAVKKLALRHSNRIDEEFESEVMLISNVHHRNLVRLLGCCNAGHNRILVYEYMKNNSLDGFLFGGKKGFLNWKQRYEVILGTAKGLTYLHEEFHIRIIHRDIKTNNILLDDDLQPRIADFGLARLIPENETHVSTKFAGTLGYTAPEYAIHGQLSEKADIYSYGVVVLEIISGKKSSELKIHGDVEGEFLLQKAWKLYERGLHLELVDNALDPKDYDVNEVKKIIEIGLLCTQASAEMRPAMSEIVVMLQKKDLLENIRPTMPILIETS